MDPKHLSQILWNLLLNAAEAIKGNGAIHVVCRVAEDMATIEITDNGCGMSDETQKQVFDPFFTTRAQGTGLGLSIVHRLLESYGGRIDVKSTEGQGTLFILYLKRIDSPNLLP
jgi:two-component system sensor histidine kinase PilS (NtrC family)